MNLEICKKCLNCKSLEFYYDWCTDPLNYKNKFYFLKLIGFPMIYCPVISKKLYKSKEEVIAIINEGKAKDFYEIDETCRFYTEQKIIDWNNK